MGIKNNECIIITTWNKKAMKTLKEWVFTLKDEHQSLFAYIPSLMNNEETLFLAPCGSKKGWEEDLELEKIRDNLIEILKSFNYSDGSNPFDWVEIGYGGYGQKVLRGNCKNCYNDNEYAI